MFCFFSDKSESGAINRATQSEIASLILLLMLYIVPFRQLSVSAGWETKRLIELTNENDDWIDNWRVTFEVLCSKSTPTEWAKCVRVSECTADKHREKRCLIHPVAILFAANKFAPKCLPLHHLVHYSGRGMPWESHRNTTGKRKK